MALCREEDTSGLWVKAWLGTWICLCSGQSRQWGIAIDESETHLLRPLYVGCPVGGLFSGTLVQDVLPMLCNQYVFLKVGNSVCGTGQLR